ncbi:MAG: T9SS type A sorting domain-containing protein [Bacteroidia bacterium]
MKKIYAAVIFICFFNLLHAQNPLVKQWDKRFGGTRDDVFFHFQQTADGGYILGGYSTSDVSGDKSQPNWDTIPPNYFRDYWIVKTDSLGNKTWDKRFGGIQDDFLYSVQQTIDGGYILGGHSNSGKNGDKTQNAWLDTNNVRTLDYWIVKTDSLGNLQWDKRFGGKGTDYCYSISRTFDGGYILGGKSNSSNDGDKSQPNWDTLNGTSDYWVVKTDSIGNKQWDIRYGGTSEDILQNLQQTIDGGYILGGWSLSDSSGDKTQSSWGGYDYWIVKIDSLGNKQWDKRFGGNNFERFYSLQQINDRGYILGGLSASGISGDKTQPNWDTIAPFTGDYWIVKIDSLGNKLWDRDFGGTANEDEFGNVTLTFDGGYLLTGTSYSDISGDKTENNLGDEQIWVVKTDSLGIKQWDKTIFTTGHDEIGYSVQSIDLCYAITVSTYAGIGGYKTQPNWDTIFLSSDYWIVKFCDTTVTTGVSNSPLERGQGCVIYPNPFTSEITINIQKENVKQANFTIKNILGQTVFREKSEILNPKSEIKFNLEFLQQGIYFLEINLSEERMVRKIIKQ